MKKKNGDNNKKSIELNPNHIFFGVLFGTVAGFIPLLSPLTFIIAFLFLIFRFNPAAGLLLFGIAKVAAVQNLAAYINKTGLYLLTSNMCLEFSRWFVSLPIITYLNFTNTAVMGGSALGLAAGLPAGFAIRQMIIKLNSARRKRFEKKENGSA